MPENMRALQNELRTLRAKMRNMKQQNIDLKAEICRLKEQLVLCQDLSQRAVLLRLERLFNEIPV